MSEARVPVLIVGGGSVGLAAALFLAHHGVGALVVEQQKEVSPHPRATGLGPRTMEFLREVGIEDAVNAVAIEMSVGMLGKISAPTLVTADWPSLIAAAPTRAALGIEDISPAGIRGTCPQHRLDSVLLPAATERGAVVRHSARLVSFDQDAAGVTAELDGPGGRETIRADYLIAADGARSSVRTLLGIGVTGPGALGNPMMNILFRADITAYTAGRPFVNCSITTPDAPGLLVTVDGAKEWIFHAEYRPETGESAQDFTTERCAELIRIAVGDPEMELEILSRLSWRARGQVADRFRAGRVFLIGDAAHTVPPLGAFGLNTGLADAHNLAWKLAAVHAGTAAPTLLDTYNAERRPVAELTLQQALLRWDNPLLHWGRGPDVVAARAAVGALNGPVVHLGYRYDSAAVIDAQPELPDTEDVTAALDGAPGSRLPHRWIEPGKISTLDLAGSQFTVLTGPEGAQWDRAVRVAADRLGLSVNTHRLTPDIAHDLGIAGTGTLLIRPDQIIAWRSDGRSADDVTKALAQVLGK